MRGLDSTPSHLRSRSFQPDTNCLRLTRTAVRLKPTLLCAILRLTLNAESSRTYWRHQERLAVPRFLQDGRSIAPDPPGIEEIVRTPCLCALLEESRTLLSRDHRPGQLEKENGKT